MAGINKVILVGNLGKDPEVRTIDSGRKVANFPIATTEVYRDRNGERQENTEWHNIVLWGGQAEVAEKYLRKGSQIYLEGKIRTRSYEDKEGVKKYITEILGQNLTMLGSRQGGDNSEGYSSRQSSESSSVDQSSAQQSEPVSQEQQGGGIDDLPF